MFFFSKNHTQHIPHWILSIKQGWKSSIFSQALVAQAFYNLDRSKMIEQFLKQKIVLNFNEMLFKNTYCLAFLGSVSSFPIRDTSIHSAEGRIGQVNRQSVLSLHPSLTSIPFFPSCANSWEEIPVTTRGLCTL